MTNEIQPKQTVRDSHVESLDLHDFETDAVNPDDFDDALVPGDTDYIDPDMADPSAGFITDLDDTPDNMLPVTFIDLSSVTKTRRVLATGEVVYDIRFNVTDIGADGYEVAFLKQ